LPKAVTFLLVAICWLLISDRQGGLQTVQAQIKFHNLPESLALKNDLPGELEVQLKVFSSLLPSAKKLDIVADLDLSKLHDGVNIVPVDSRSFQLPMGVSLIKASPSSLRIVAENKVSRELPVLCRTDGRLPGRLRLKSIKSEPARVRVVGPESTLAQLRYVQTENIDLAAVAKSQSINVRLIAPAPDAQLNESSVRVSLVVAR
jgi:YbbR domain-containing protein